AGLPSVVHETLPKTANFSIYVRDRKPFVRFSAKAYVLPRTGQRGIPVVTVNTKSVAVEIYRISDRNLIDTVLGRDFQRNLARYELERIGDSRGVKVWSGELAVEQTLNAEITTAFPVDRERGGDLGVERLLDGKLAAPHLDPAAVADALQLVAGQIALEVAPKHGVDQVAVADPVDFDGDRLGVDGDHRDAALAGARQHVGLRGKAHERLAVAHIDREVGGLGQRLVHHRRQAGAQRDLIALAVLETLDAELLFFRRERG